MIVREKTHAYRLWAAKLPGWVALFAVLLLLVAWPRVSQAADPEVKVGQTVEITSSHRYCWYPTIHRFPTGEIMVAMRMSPDETNPEGDFSAYCISKDEGATWSRRYTMGSGANMDAAWSVEPEIDGTIWHLYGWIETYPSGQNQDFHLTLTKWSRGGMEFEERRDVPLHFPKPILMRPTSLFDRRVSDGHLTEQPVAVPWGTIIHGLNGDLLAVVECKTVEHTKYYRDVLIRSHDAGKTWKQVSVVAAVEPEDQPWPWMGKEGPNEAALVRLADGRLLTVFRTGIGNLGETWSSDDGKTWTPPIAAPFKGVAPRVRRLSNGMLALTTGRPDPVEVMLSVDGTGKEWTQPTTIFDGKSTHYTDFIEIRPGELFVVYDSVPYGWFEIPFADRESKNVVYGTYVSVSK
jgi:hypothetical protein